MKKRKRGYILDERVQAIVDHAKQLSGLLNFPIAHCEHFFFALTVHEEEFLRPVFKETGLTYIIEARESARDYFSQPIRHEHVSNDIERDAGMSKKLQELLLAAANIAAKMTDDSPVVVTPQLALLAAETDRVGRDIVQSRWGINFNELRMYYRRIGIKIPITYTEQEQLWAVNGTDVDGELERHVAREKKS